MSTINTTGSDNHCKIAGRRSGLDRRVLSDPNYQGLEQRLADRRSGFEKRMHPRYRVKDLIYANLRSESDEEIGQLLDISKGGISRYYLVKIERSKDYSELEIFPHSDTFSIEKICFRTVSDTPLIDEAQYNLKILRRQGLQFEDLTREQKTKLDYFLKNFTVGTA